MSRAWLLQKLLLILFFLSVPGESDRDIANLNRDNAAASPHVTIGINERPTHSMRYVNKPHEDPVLGFQEIKGHIQSTLNRHGKDIIGKAKDASKLAGDVGSAIDSYKTHLEGVGNTMSLLDESSKNLHTGYGKLLKLDSLKALSKADAQLLAKAEHAVWELRKNPELDSGKVAEKYASLSHKFQNEQDAQENSGDAQLAAASANPQIGEDSWHEEASSPQLAEEASSSQLGEASEVEASSPQLGEASEFAASSPQLAEASDNFPIDEEASSPQLAQASSSSQHLAEEPSDPQNLAEHSGDPPNIEGSGISQLAEEASTPDFDNSVNSQVLAGPPRPQLEEHDETGDSELEQDGWK